MPKNIWVERSVIFTPFPRANAKMTDAQFESLMDDIAETFWNGFWHAFFELSVSSTARQIEVGGWPWWIPKRFARRAVINIVINHDLGGDAEYVVCTTYLANREEKRLSTETPQNRRAAA